MPGNRNLTGPKPRKYRFAVEYRVAQHLGLSRSTGLENAWGQRSGQPGRLSSATCQGPKMTLLDIVTDIMGLLIAVKAATVIGVAILFLAAGMLVWRTIVRTRV